VALGGDRAGTVTGLEVFEPGGAAIRFRVAAGQIARVRGLDTARIGDWIGAPTASATDSVLPAPGLEARVVPRDCARRADLHQALAELVDIDPLIAVRLDRGTARVRLYGEVQQQDMRSKGDVTTVTGTVPAAVIGPLRTGLHAAAHGEGVLESILDHYTPRRRTA
jgi:translation elongation factor EF-G